MGYVFPTSLKPTDVGFSNTEGIVALALTSHPDFDDTPLWDENSDSNYANDGIIWHPHWVILTEDKRVEGGLAVKQFDPKTQLWFYHQQTQECQCIWTHQDFKSSQKAIQ